MNREEIMEILPHRDNMLLVDEIKNNDDGSVTGFYTVKGDEFFLKGHFPNNPIVPGVMLCEMASQSACALMVEKVKGKLTFLTGMKNVKFKNPAKVGDTIAFNVKPLKKLGVFAFVQAEARVNDTIIMTGEFSYALVDNPNK